jgi:hypothetical protein
MSDPRNVAHAKKVTQEKKHHTAAVGVADAPAVQPGRKPAKKKGGASVAGGLSANTAEGDAPAPIQSPAPPAALEPSLAVLGKLKEIEFHSRATLQRLAELELTVADELKQTEIVGPLGEALSAQNAFQTKLTALIEIYKAECDRLQGQSA